MFPAAGGGAYVRLLSSVYLATLVIRLAFGIVVVTFAEWWAGLDRSFGVFGLIVGASPLLELLTAIFLGPFIDRHGGKRILITGLVLGGISLAGLALTTNIAVVALANAVHGVSAAAILVPTLALIATVVPENKRGREMGLFNFANMFGWFLGFGIGYALLDVFRHDLRITFVIAGGLALAAAVYAWLMMGEGWKGGDEEHVSFRTLPLVLRERQVLLLGALWLIVFLFIGPFITFQSPVTSALAVDSNTLALGVVVVGVVFVASQIVYGKLSDIYGRNPFLLLGALGFTGLMLIVASASANTNGDFVRASALVFGSKPLVVLMSVLSLATMALPPAALAALADVAQHLPKGITMSVYTVALALGFSLGSAIVGFVGDLLSTPGVVTYFVLLSLALLFVVVVRYAQTREGLPLPDLSWLRRSQK